MPRPRRSEGYPSLAAREHWSKYAAGMLTEVVFVLVLTLTGLLLAILATVVYR